MLSLYIAENPVTAYRYPHGHVEREHDYFYSSMYVSKGVSKQSNTDTFANTRHKVCARSEGRDKNKKKKKLLS